MSNRNDNHNTEQHLANKRDEKRKKVNTDTDTNDMK